MLRPRRALEACAREHHDPHGGLGALKKIGSRPGKKIPNQRSLSRFISLADNARLSVAQTPFRP